MTTELIAALRLIASLNDPTAAAVAREAVARFEKAPAAGKVTYMVQGRCCVEGVPGPWTDAPDDAVKDIYGAIHLLETWTANCKNPEQGAPTKALGKFMRAIVEMYHIGKATLEMRIVKRTTVDEVIEETVRAI